MLNLGLESYRNWYGTAIVKAVLLFIPLVACVWMCPIEKRPLASKTAVIKSYLTHVTDLSDATVFFIHLSVKWVECLWPFTAELTPIWRRAIKCSKLP